MANKMEMAISALVIIAIIISASTLWYSFTVVSEINKVSSNMADLTSSMIELTGELSNLATSVNASLETIDAIDERLKDVEASLMPTITVVGPWSGAEMDAFLPILARFEALSGINVRYRILRAEDLSTLLPAQFAAGKAPGDVIFMWGWFIAQQAQNGHVMEATDLIDEANFLSGTFDPVTVDDSIYGGAYTGKVKPGFWYRKSKFEDWGITPTTVNSTWSEFMAMLDEVATHTGKGIPIASGDGVGWPLTDITEHFLITYGGPQLQKDLIAGEVDWTSSQVRNVFEDRLVPLLEGDYFSEPTEWTTAVDLWWEGDYGLYFMGSWITGMVDNATDLGVIPLPGCEALVLPADYFFIPAYTEYPEEAKELFQFLASAEAQRLQVAQGGHLATNVNVGLDEYPPADRQVAQFIEDFGIAADLDDTIGGEFQSTFWDQLKLLWADPTALNDVLTALEEVAP